MKEDSTHLIFNEKGIFISPDIQPVFTFLMNIERETESFLGVERRLSDIKESYLEVLRVVILLSSTLKENNIDFSYKLEEPLEKVTEKFNPNIPLRSRMIVLFASLDVLFNLNTAYEFEVDDEDILRNLTMDTDKTKKFLNSFILSEENQYYMDNQLRLSKVDSAKLRDLRNSLMHFFSIGRGGLSLAPDLLSDKSRKVENVLKQSKNGNVIFISEQDLYGLVKSANILRMRRWSEDFQSDPFSFKKKMQCVINLVEKKAPVILMNKEVNI